MLYANNNFGFHTATFQISGRASHWQRVLSHETLDLEKLRSCSRRVSDRCNNEVDASIRTNSIPTISTVDRIGHFGCASH